MTEPQCAAANKHCGNVPVQCGFFVQCLSGPAASQLGGDDDFDGDAGLAWKDAMKAATMAAALVRAMRAMKAMTLTAMTGEGERQSAKAALPRNERQGSLKQIGVKKPTNPIAKFS